MKRSVFLSSVVYISAVVLACQPVEVGKTPGAGGSGGSSGGGSSGGSSSSGGGSGGGATNGDVRPGIDVSACIPSGAPTGSYDKDAFLANAYQIILDTYKWFLEDAKVLDYNMGQLCANLADADLQQNVLESFDAAMKTWEVAEVMKAGPIHGTGREGQGVRDQIYSWYVGKDACAVDQNVASGSVDDDVSIKGLDALEYLLSHPGASVCGHELLAPGVSAPSASTEDELCAYQKAITAQLAADTENAISVWEGFKDTFLTGTHAQGEVRSINGEEMVYHALAIYMDKYGKELKLYRPFGNALKIIVGDGQDTVGASDEIIELPSESICGQKVCCPEDVEAPFRRNSAELLMSNVTGLEMLFYGISPTAAGGACNVGQGFRDLLYGCGTAVDTGRTGSAIADSLASAAKNLKSGLSSVSNGDLATFVAAYRDAGNKCEKLAKSSDPKVLAIVEPFEVITAIFRDEVGKASDGYKKNRTGCREDMLLPRDVDGDGDG